MVKQSKYFGKSVDKDTDGLNWCVASAEVSDFENDIVDLESIDLTRHTLEHPIPVISSHLKKLPDGTFPILGEVVQWQKGTMITPSGKSVNALYAGWKWADKENPDLVNKIKPLYPRLVNNFSVSFIPDETNVSREIDGQRLKNCVVTELSLTLTGANPHAMALKELKKSLGDIMEDNTNEMNMSKKDMDEMMMSYTKSTHELYANQMQDMVTKNTDCLNKCVGDMMKGINDRFDALESAIASMTAEPTPTGIKSKSEVSKEFDELKHALDQMAKRFS